MKRCLTCGETDPAQFDQRRQCRACLRAFRRRRYSEDTAWQLRQRYATLVQRAVRAGVQTCTYAEFLSVMQLPKGCPYCGYVMQELSETHLDHTVPLAQGGDSLCDNLRLVCPWCNRAKGADETAFQAWLARLRHPF